MSTNGNYYDPNANGIEGWMNSLELLILNNLARKVTSVVEIGSWKGRSTHALCSGCKGIVYAVDHFQGSAGEITTTHREAVEGGVYDEFMKNVGHFPNLKVMKMSSREASKLIPKVDMVFIDGGHDYDSFRMDLLCWAPKAKYVLCGHDGLYPGVMKALEDIGIYYYGIDRTAIWIQKRWI